MSRSESAAELSMEDILASIRSLVPADQRGEADDGKTHAPLVPPTLNRVERAAPPPPTLPLGTLSAARKPAPFEDDLADLLDDPSDVSPPARQIAADAPMPPTPPPPPAAPAMASPLPPSRAGLDLDALFAKPASAAPQAAERAPAVIPSVPASRETPSEPAAAASPPVMPPQSPLMGLGQNGGFFPPPFGKRPAPPPPLSPQASAPEAEPTQAETPAPRQVNGEAGPLPAAIPPLRRAFFPANFQSDLSVASSAPPPPFAHSLERATDASAGDAPPGPVGAVMAEDTSLPAADADERQSYSDALDQALKRLQGLGSLMPEPTPNLEAPAREPEFVSAAPQASREDEPAPLAALGPQAVTMEAAVDEVVPAAGPQYEPEPQVIADAEPVATVIEDELPESQPAAVLQPTVRLSDALWSKHATSQSSEAVTPANSEAAIPETVDLLDVPPASPVVQAFGALALGLAGGGSAATASSASMANVSPQPPTPLIVVEDAPAATAPEPEPQPRHDAGAVALRPVEDPLAFAGQAFSGHPFSGQAFQAQPLSAQAPPPQAPASGEPPRTLEDMVADMLRPMLKQWLETNMPRIVEKALRAETSSKRD